MILVDGNYERTSVIESTSSTEFKKKLDEEITRLSSYGLVVQIEIHAPVGCVDQSGTKSFMFSATLIGTSGHPKFS